MINPDVVNEHAGDESSAKSSAASGGNGSIPRGIAESPERLAEYLGQHGCPVKRIDRDADKAVLILDGCPMNPEHGQGTDTAVIWRPTGIGFECKHNGCANFKWTDLRRRIHPDYDARKSRNTDTGRDSILATPRPWPTLAPAALHGLAGRIVRLLNPHTEADPVAILIQLHAAFGNVIGRGPHFRAEADRHFTAEYAVLVGETSKGRKGTSWSQVRQLFGSVDSDWCDIRVMSGLSSGEGLIWAVRDPIVKREPIRESGSGGRRGRVIDYEDVEVDPGVPDKRLMIVEPEFASALKVMTREGNTLSAIIRRAWDGSNVLASLTKNSPAKATGAHISIIGHVTRDELLRHLDDTEFLNGFANRFLWVCVRRSKCLPEGGQLHLADVGPIAREIADAVTFARGVGELKRNEAARRLWADVYPALSAGRRGLLGAALGRAEAQVMRLAAFYALENRSAVVTAEHLGAALALWRYCEDSAEYIFGDALGDPVADEILRALRQTPGGLTRDQIRELFGRHKGRGEIERALSVLVRGDLARCEREETLGRPRERWFAITTGCAESAKSAESPPPPESDSHVSAHTAHTAQGDAFSGETAERVQGAL